MESDHCHHHDPFPSVSLTESASPEYRLMKSHSKPKAGGGTWKAFELKQQLTLSLNKISDCRHRCPFFSCASDTDADQKSDVRKEYVRVMEALTRYYSPLPGSHLSKIAVSIVKWLKDPDLVVRDACVETAGANVKNGGVVKV